LAPDSVTDWIAALATLAGACAAGYGAYFGITTFRHQRTVNDVSLALSIFGEINRYWDRITDSRAEDHDYNMGQILAQFEIAAALFNQEILTNTALPILKDHIIEVFSSITTDTYGKELLGRCASSPETFVELRKFSRSHMPTALRFLQHEESN
jgi:hypothetical protein